MEWKKDFNKRFGGKLVQQLEYSGEDGTTLEREIGKGLVDFIEDLLKKERSK
jgi:hypothetical protein